MMGHLPAVAASGATSWAGLHPRGTGRRGSGQGAIRPTRQAPSTPSWFVGSCASPAHQGMKITRPAPPSVRSRRPAGIVVRASASDGPEGALGDSSRPLSAICRDLNRHFLEACLPQLGVPYNTALASFVGAAKEAYVGGASVSAIALQWQMSGGDTGWDVLDTFLEQKGGLQAEELELRSSWLSTCFLTFSEANLLREETPVAVEAGLDEARLGFFVQNVTEMAKRGSGVQRVKLQEVLAMSGGLDEPRSELESAALSQGIRLVFLALETCGARTHDGEPISASVKGGPTESEENTQEEESWQVESKEKEQSQQGKSQADSDAARSARFKARIEVERKAAAATEVGAQDSTENAARSARFKARIEAERKAAATSEAGAQDSTQAAPTAATEPELKLKPQPQPQPQPGPKGTDPYGRESGLSTQEEIRARLSKLRAREIKAQLEAKSIGTSDCFDKEGLLDKLTRALVAEQNGSTTSGSKPATGAISATLNWTQAASLFAGVTAQQGLYAGVDLTVKAGTQSFVIDTAASVNILTPERAQLIQARRTGVTASGQGGTGALGNSYEVSLGEACLGGIDLRGSDFRAVVMPAPVAPGYAGIIGLTFLNAFDAVDFRWGQRPGEVLFHPQGSSAPWSSLAEGLTTFDLEIITSGLPCVSVSVGGRPPIRALVDTGAAFSVVNSAAGIATDPSVQDMVVTGLDGRPMPLGVSACDEEIRLGSVTVGSGRLLVGDLPAFAMLAGAATQPALILGLDILSQRPRLLFSATQRKMAL